MNNISVYIDKQLHGDKYCLIGSASRDIIKTFDCFQDAVDYIAEANAKESTVREYSLDLSSIV